MRRLIEMNKNEEKLFWHLCSFLESNGDSMKKVIKEAATPEVLGQLFFGTIVLSYKHSSTFTVAES